MAQEKGTREIPVKTSELNVVAVVESLAERSVAAHLLDRFLIGHAGTDGFRAPQHRLKRVFVASKAKDKARQEAGLEFVDSVQRAVTGAHAVLVVADKPFTVGQTELLMAVVNAAEKGTRIFSWGAVGAGVEESSRVEQLAMSRGLRVCSGSWLPVTWRLPDLDIENDEIIEAALLANVGPRDESIVTGFDALQALVERRPGGEAGVARVRRFVGDEVWRELKKAPWERLLDAALSRTDAPLGDTLKDGRTQNIVGLGMLPSLVSAPEMVTVEHRDGLASAVLRVDGAVRDRNGAVKTARGLRSMQFLRPQLPQEQQFSRLSEAVEEFFVHADESRVSARGRGRYLAVLQDALRRNGAVSVAAGYPSPARSAYRRQVS